MIKVRFAPSPTGFLHIGGARTALFNWMYAKAQGGQFVLRIEDTDQQRSSKDFVEEILDSMKWCGFDWDEIYYQSERFDIYRKYAHQLLDEGKAYKEGEAIILKMLHQEVKLFDLIRGEIVHDTALIKDQVLMKSDGSPAYSFCCVVDDALMEISHVIRGEDHISNTPKQIMIYQALGFKVPKFAHLPLIMGEDGSRLSKRTGAVAVSDYRKEGYLAEALVNYLMLLGWSPGNNQEKVDMEAAVKKFSIKKVNKAAAVFSIDKLKWLNGQYIKPMDTHKLQELLMPFLKEKGYLDGNLDGEKINNIVDLFKGRLATLKDFVEWADFFFLEGPVIEEEARDKHLTQDHSKIFESLCDGYKRLDVFNAMNAEAVFKKVVEDNGIKPGDLVHPVRVAITGKAIGPSLFEIMAVLGKEKTVERLSAIYAS